jgi:hypothetical protein
MKIYREQRKEIYRELRREGFRAAGEEKRKYIQDNFVSLHPEKTSYR